MIAVVATEHGAYEVDLDDEEVLGHVPGLEVRAPHAEVSLPRLVAAAAFGSRVVAVVDAKPPLLVSHDAGHTWSESGRGLPPLHAVAVAEENPDVVLAASRNRLHLSRDGGRFWTTLAVELPRIEAVTFRAA